MAKNGQTEKATPQKRKQAREKGNVPQSKEMAIFFNTVAFTLFLAFFGSWFVNAIINLQAESLNIIYADMNVFEFTKFLVIEGVMILLPMAGLCLVFVAMNYMLQIRFLFAPKAIKPDIQKINPKQFFSNLFKRKTIIQILKQLVLVTVLGYIVYVVFTNRASEIAMTIRQPWEQSLIILWGVFKEVIYKVLIALFIIGVLDYFYQKWEYEDSLKMKKQDVRRDHKDSDGDPQVKMRQNQRRIALLKNDTHKRMKEEVTFLATNPTHYAVAVYFKPGKGNPKVVIKGVDHMALFMKEVAKKHQVPIYEDPPLARELYSKVLENEEIPEEMWAAVAVVIRTLMKRKEIDL